MIDLVSVYYHLLEELPAAPRELELLELPELTDLLPPELNELPELLEPEL